MPSPLQVIAVRFGPDADFRGRILAEVDRLEGRGVLRLLDLLLVAKRDDGTLERLVVGDDEDFGTLLASIVPLDAGSSVGFRAADAASGFDPASAWDLASSLRPGTALAFLLVEHVWAGPLFDAVAETGGMLLGEGFLTTEAGLLVGAEVEAMEEAAEVVAAAEARATAAIAASDAIAATAAARAVSALITAGLVEQAAAAEALDALTAAGLVAAAADEAASEAAAEGAATVRAASISLVEAQVLRYLPTAMTFAVIADKLGISRSAAKERAERAYKKLGVHNRADAVARARELRLLD